MISKPKTTFGRPIIPSPERIAELYTESISAGWLTNSGPLHNQFEKAISLWFDSNETFLTSSGTMALMIGLHAGNLEKGAEVITSPLSFAASAHAIYWSGFTPVFADICPKTMTLSVDSVAAAITPNTKAIMPVHFLGQACEVDKLSELAKRHNLWLLYDACHAFGTTINGNSISNYGDASAFSLHATKLLHSGEGGALVLNSSKNGIKIPQIRNFGLSGGKPIKFGINGKLPEASAAVGLAVMDLVDDEIIARKALRRKYNALLSDLPNLNVVSSQRGVSDNLIYYAIRIPPSKRAACVVGLAEIGVLARDYFPLLCGPGTAFPNHAIASSHNTPVAPIVAPEIICLPFHSGVDDESVVCIANIIKSKLSNTNN